MIRYSSYNVTNYQKKLPNYREKLSARIELPVSLEKEYRELQELRERVRRAEAAAKRRGPRPD